MSKTQREKMMTGMSVVAAKAKFREIFAKAKPGVNFRKTYPGAYVWMETWFRLRSRNETFEQVALAFAEKVSRLHKQNHELAERIHLQRLEMVKRLAEIDALKARVAESTAKEK